ncbi:McrC family protein [Tistrella bauzanensis]|uniref:McrC family protein n=1 Tax=Tistrella bauzanensis TaxID=657419 RepID=UPI001E3D826C
MDRKSGVSQADVYQMMAYARLYKCDRLMLLYPATPAHASGIIRRFGIDGGRELLALGRVDMTVENRVMQSQLRSLIDEVLGINHDNINDYYTI